MPKDYNFEKHLSSYHESVNDHVTKTSAVFLESYGESDGADIGAEAYVEILSRGGKRIRGALVLNGYEMCGGTNTEMILQAASAVEMMHAYILVIDDIQDRSDIRRGGPSAHKIVEQFSRDNGWDGDHAHTGRSIATDGALAANHFAINIFQDLKVTEKTRIKVTKMMNNTMILTAKGQTGDIINEVNGAVTARDIEKVILRKTALYSILNPLQIGMILAGAKQSELEAVEKYAIQTGKAYQIGDDALTYLSKRPDKDLSADIRDGKMTLIMLTALNSLSDKKSLYLRSCLGKQDLTVKEFKTCVKLVLDSGAVEKVLGKAGKQVEKILNGFNNLPKNWRRENVEFLRGLARFSLNRVL